MQVWINKNYNKELMSQKIKEELIDWLDRQCPICMEKYTYTDNEFAARIVCGNGHNVCRICYQTYRYEYMNTTCPICVAPMLNYSVHNSALKCALFYEKELYKLKCLNSQFKQYQQYFIPTFKIKVFASLFATLVFSLLYLCLYAYHQQWYRLLKIDSFKNYFLNFLPPVIYDFDKALESFLGDFYYFIAFSWTALWKITIITILFGFFSTCYFYYPFILVQYMHDVNLDEIAQQLSSMKYDESNFQKLPKYGYKKTIIVAAYIIHNCFIYYKPEPKVIKKQSHDLVKMQQYVQSFMVLKVIMAIPFCYLLLCTWKALLPSYNTSVQNLVSFSSSTLKSITLKIQQTQEAYLDQHSNYLVQNIYSIFHGLLEGIAHYFYWVYLFLLGSSWIVNSIVYYLIFIALFCLILIGILGFICFVCIFITDVVWGIQIDTNEGRLWSEEEQKLPGNWISKQLFIALVIIYQTIIECKSLIYCRISVFLR